MRCMGSPRESGGEVHLVLRLCGGRSVVSLLAWLSPGGLTAHTGAGETPPACVLLGLLLFPVGHGQGAKDSASLLDALQGTRPQG